ncbi:MAG: hypothetical protein IH625_01200 [Rhodobacteraceae bacterium]|nr:hypothetical protein [Paracoccaceae bacterium]
MSVKLFAKAAEARLLIFGRVGEREGIKTPRLIVSGRGPEVASLGKRPNVVKSSRKHREKPAITKADAIRTMFDICLPISKLEEPILGSFWRDDKSVKTALQSSVFPIGPTEPPPFAP